MYNYLRKFIVKIKAYSTIYEDCFAIVSFLKNNKIDTVLDIGANKGQYAKSLRRFGYSGRIISFEPLIEEFNLLREASKNDPNWIVDKPIAIGDKKKFLFINIAKNSVSSSFKKVGSKHLEADMGAKKVGRQISFMNKIDNIINHYCTKKNKIFLKSDTQGFDMEVLKGAKKTLKKNNLLGIQIELSLVSLYHSDKSYIKICDFLDKRGFEPFDMFKGFRNKKTNKLLQLDFLFSKK